MNYFIRQFGNPTGSFGIFLYGIMNLSNKRMYKANIHKLDGRKRILEIGFGNGRQLEMINECFQETALYGVDISEDMCDVARKRLGKRADLIMADACSLPYTDQSFDAVITTDTFYFWRDTARILQEISRILTSDGIFVNTYNKLYAAFVGKGTNEFRACKEQELTLPPK